MKQEDFSKLTVGKGNKGFSAGDRVSKSVRGQGNSSSYLQPIINSLEDELIVIDWDYRIVEANEALLLRHGKHRQEVIGKHCYEVSHGLRKPCRPPRRECPLKMVWETGKPARVTHAHIYNVEGEKRERYVDIIASPITDSQGNVTAVTELMRDVTEAKELELRIAEAHRELSALNAIASVVSKSLDLDTVLSSALNKTLEIMKGNIGGILLLDEERQMLCYRVHRGLSNRYVGEMCLRLGEGIAGRVAQTGEAILAEDISIRQMSMSFSVLPVPGGPFIFCFSILPFLYYRILIAESRILILI